MSKIYFASDFHLGSPHMDPYGQREKLIVDWLHEIKDNATDLYLVGDIFDFWFEYKKAIPKGFVRFQGKIAELVDYGVNVHFFVGNHDLWMNDYFAEEIGVKVHKDSLIVNHGASTFFITHGDGKGPKDVKYKRLKRIFQNRFCQWLFRCLHPDIGISIASKASHSSRASNPDTSEFLGKDKEWLLQYAVKKSDEMPQIDYFIFGHRHYPVDVLLPNNHSRYINLGDWIQYFTYGVWDGTHFELCSYNDTIDTKKQVYDSLYS